MSHYRLNTVMPGRGDFHPGNFRLHTSCMNTAMLSPPDRPLSVPDLAEHLGVRVDRLRLLLRRHAAQVAGLVVVVGGRRQIDPEKLPELRRVLGLEPGGEAAA